MNLVFQTTTQPCEVKALDPGIVYVTTSLVFGHPVTLQNTFRHSMPRRIETLFVDDLATLSLYFLPQHLDVLRFTVKTPRSNLI